MEHHKQDARLKLNCSLHLRPCEHRNRETQQRLTNKYYLLDYVSTALSYADALVVVTKPFQASQSHTSGWASAGIIMQFFSTFNIKNPDVLDSIAE